MKVTLIICALFYVHIARGSPVEPKPAEKTAKAAPADQAPQAAPAAPAVPEKPETCKANINGTEQTLQTGDRYCLDDTTHRVCNYGDWIDNPCDPGSKCLKSPTSWQVLCRIIHRNPPQNPPPGTQDDTPSKPASAPNNPEPAPSNPAPAPSNPAPAPSNPAPAPSNPAPAPSNPAPAPSNPAPAPSDPVPAPSNPAPSNPAPSNPAPSNPAPSNPAPSNPAPSNPSPPTKEEPPKPVDSKPAQTTPEKPETCKATINGQEQTLQPGDRYCLDDHTNRVCNWGEFVDFACPDGSTCLKSPDKWQVLCRIINKSHPPVSGPLDGTDGH